MVVVTWDSLADFLESLDRLGLDILQTADLAFAFREVWRHLYRLGTIAEPPPTWPMLSRDFTTIQPDPESLLDHFDRVYAM